MSFRVQQANPADLTRLEDLLESCLGEKGSGPGQSDGIRYLLGHPSQGRIGVVRDGDRIVAMVGLISTISTAQGGLVLWVEDLWVDPAHPNDGCEALLIEYAVQYARENGFSRITALPRNASPKAERTLRENGFESSGMIPLRRPTLASSRGIFRP
jgi:GNAT superfamily N-acetyltransferase